MFRIEDWNLSQSEALSRFHACDFVLAQNPQTKSTFPILIRTTRIYSSTTQAGLYDKQAQANDRERYVA